MVNETPNVRCSWEFDNDRKHRTKTSPLQVFVNVHVLAGIRSLVNLVRKPPSAVNMSEVDKPAATLLFLLHAKRSDSSKKASRHGTKHEGWKGAWVSGTT